MKKRNTWFFGLAAAALLVGAQTVQAGSVADGAYLGVKGGFGTSIVDASVTANRTTTDANGFSFADGGLGLDGASYGAFMGYGFRMSSLYAGFEVGGHWSNMKLDPGTFTIKNVGTSTNATAAAQSGNNAVSQASAELAFTGSVAGRLGYYLNPSTLFVLNGGLVGSQFDVSWDGQAEEYWDPGTAYGVGIESTVFDGVAVRLNWQFVDYYDAEVFGIGSFNERPGTMSVEIQPTMNVAHLGLIYTF